MLNEYKKQIVLLKKEDNISYLNDLSQIICVIQIILNGIWTIHWSTSNI